MKHTEETILDYGAEGISSVLNRESVTISGKRTVCGQNSGKRNAPKEQSERRISQVYNRVAGRYLLSFFVFIFEKWVMEMKIIILTNNAKVHEKYKDTYHVQYEECSYKEVLYKVRDHVHRGHELLTHPLSGSVKPNETPFKSILLDGKTGEMNLDSLRIIEKSIETAEKFYYDDRKIDEEILKDFRTIDLSLVENVIKKLF